MRSLPKIQNEHPDAYIVFVGGHDVSYAGQLLKMAKVIKIIFIMRLKNC